MIPKKIHYCWFGGKPLGKLETKCVASWKKFCPDYEIIEWNEANFDVNAIKYTKQAYEAKKYAFVSDYARFDILYREGGIYLDTDVELIKPLDELLIHKVYMGFERPGLVNSGLGFGTEAGHELLQYICESYRARAFLKDDGSPDYTTVVQIVSSTLYPKGLTDENTIQVIDGCTIFPMDYFQPIDQKTRKKYITQNTFSIHHYAASWYSKRHKFLKKIGKLMPPGLTRLGRKILGRDKSD
ncbi:MAG: glycosyl transferase [Firmicutes bacterium]|nr:glycosyl transferase [Bacillota bacterium]